MKYSIFHTSHCGSTLLAVMLSKSVSTVTEPLWSHEIRRTENFSEKLKLVENNHKEDLLVKYPSLCTEVAPFVEGKKIFLYRNFKSHMNKLAPDDWLYEANFWNQRFNNLINSKDVLFIDSDYFLKNQQSTCEEICSWFSIVYKPLPDIDFHVKEAGYNHNDNPIKLW